MIEGPPELEKKSTQAKAKTKQTKTCQFLRFVFFDQMFDLETFPTAKMQFFLYVESDSAPQYAPKLSPRS